MPRVTTVITSINSNTSEAVTISSVSWSTDSGTITLSAAVPAAVKVGDIINDSAGNDYLITGISGSDLTCQDFETTTDPATGAATITEAYVSGITWEADLDADGTNTEVYKSADDAVGHLYGTTDGLTTINGGTTVGLNSVTITTPQSERHDGTPGTGAGVTVTAAFGAFYVTRPNVIIEWLDLQNVKPNGNRSISMNDGSADFGVIRNCIMVSTSTSGSGSVFDVGSSGATNGTLHNCMLIGGYARGFARKAAEAGWTISNVTIHDCGRDGTSVGMQIDTGYTVTNCLVTDSGGADYAGTPGTSATNLSSDGTAPSGTGDDPTTSANNYVSNSSPYDLHLVDTDADAFEAGTDLGTTDGVNIDIDGRDRDTQGDTWCIGADQYVGAAPAGGAAMILGGGLYS